jgi:hypothetical protein
MPPAPNRQTTGSKITVFWVTHQTGNDRSILSRPPLVFRCSSALSRASPRSKLRARRYRSAPFVPSHLDRISLNPYTHRSDEAIRCEW